MGSIFISYAREDIDFVRKLHGALNRGGHEVWVDWEGIPPIGEWLAEIHRAVDAADACLFVLSPDFLQSEPCAAELKRALEQHKRLVPIIRHDVDDKKVHPEMAKLNWIFLRDADHFENAIEALDSAIDTDLEWVQEHTRLIGKAGEWQEYAGNSSYTLRGEELAHFEAWLTKAGEKEPKPTQLQTEFVLASRRAATRKQRVIFSAAAIVIIVIAISSVWAIFANREKQRQAEIAEARKLLYRAEAERDRPEGLTNSVRSTVKALKRFNGIGVTSPEADAAVRRGLSLLPRKEIKFAPRLGEAMGSDPMVLSDPMGRFLLIKHALPRKAGIFIWGTEQGVALCESELQALDSVSVFGVSSAARRVAIVTQERETRALTIFELDGCKPVARFELSFDPLIVRLSPQGTYAAAARFPATRLWRVGTREEITVDHDTLSPYDIAFNPSEKLFAALYHDKEAGKSLVRIIDPATGAEQTRWTLADSFLSAYEWTGLLKWGPNPRRLRLRTRFRDYIYDPKRSRLIAVRRPSQAVTDASGGWVAEGVGTNTVRVRSAKSGRAVARLIHQTKVQAVVFRPNDRSVVTLGSRYFAKEFPIRQWHLDGTGSIAEIRQDESIDKIHFSEDSRLIFTRTPGGPQSWHLPQSHGQIGVARLRPAEKNGVSQSTSLAKRFDVIRVKNRLEAIDRIDERVVRSIEVYGETFATAVSGDGKWLALIAKPAGSTRGGWELKAELYSLQDQSPAREIQQPDFTSDDAATFLQFSSDGRYLLTATRSLFRVWDVAALKPVSELYQAYPHRIAVQPHGDLAATTAKDGMIRVWRISDGFEIIRIENDEPVKELGISPDGRWLASLHEAGFARLWALRPPDLIAQACNRLAPPCP